MKKTLYSLLCALTISISVCAQHLEGAWSGELNLGPQKLGIIFRFNNQNGNTVCTMDVPMQSIKGFPINIAKMTDTQIELVSAPLAASFKGEIVGPNLIKGTWTQSGKEWPLELTQGESKKANRPQEPDEPFGYQRKEIAIYNAKDAVWLGATLTFPVDYTSEKDCPAVVMVSGSGAQDRDEKIFDHKPFLVIADYLAKRGIATLRYDDRGVGKSTGNPQLCTTDDFTEDAKAAIHHLKQHYAFKKVGVIGHSEGGTIAFKLAAAHQVDFMVSMAGPGIKGDTLLTEQINAMNKLAGQPANLTVEQMKIKLGTQLENPWMKWFLEYDPASTIASVKIPVMAVNGSKDVQVIAKSNLEAIKKWLKNKNPQNLIKEYPDLNHLFQHCNTGLPTEYYSIEETISPQVMRDIADWVNSL